MNACRSQGNPAIVRASWTGDVLSPGTTVRQQGTTDVRQMYDSYDSYDSTTVRHLRQLYDSDHVCELSYPPTTATTATTGLRQMYDSYDSSPPGVAQFDWDAFG